MTNGTTEPGSFGRVLRRMRIAAGLTQQALSARSGISVDAISALENGRNRRPHRDTLRMLADGLGLGPAEREVLEATAQCEGRPRPSRHPERAVVFLSHTSELRSHPAGRSFVAAAEAAAVGAGFSAIDMDSLPPSNATPSDLCTAAVASSHVYVGIVGLRYGTPVRNRPELSYTELEFEVATACRMPRLVFLVREDARSLPRPDQPAEHEARQRVFRARLQEAGVTVALVGTPEELERRLRHALDQLRAPAKPAVPRQPAAPVCAVRPSSPWTRRIRTVAARLSRARPGRLAALALALAVLGALLPQAGGGGSVQFVGSQAQPLAEARSLYGDVLSGFQGGVEFSSQATAAEVIQTILNAPATGVSPVDLTDLTYSEMAALASSDTLMDLTPLLQRLQREGRRFPKALLDSGKLGTRKQYYIPWLQATYMMAVNKKALQYLPKGADVNNLTYDQLIEWGQRIKSATGKSKIGLPADLRDGVKGGLVSRFLEGYAYPSFTGATLTDFTSPEAVQMWTTLRRLWEVTNPDSSGYVDMQDPLLKGDVWIAWDHQARLKDALKDTSRFEAVPAPTGPKGLGYISVVVGLAIPRTARNIAGAEALIDYLTRPTQQAAASASLSFLPTVEGVKVTGSGVPAYLDAEARVATAYNSSTNPVVAMLPVGLGSETDAFTLAYQDTFTRIVLRQEPIQAVLDDEAVELQTLLDKTRAGCWPPDPASAGPCRVK